MIKNKSFFTKQLMTWYDKSERELPWKGIKNPYFIWLSEIILQQTRAAQGMPYYEKFKNKYPTIDLMAVAPEDEIMKLWEGLGYYSRARNMHFTAKYIVTDLEGKFPNTHKDLLKLKGVGPYTAAAIASFAYNLPHAVLDGNVFRVLSRFFGIEEPIDMPKSRQLYEQLAQELLDTPNAGVYNQAIMDFGATQCKPKAVDCTACPLAEKCVALQKSLVNTLPFKLKKLKRSKRYFHYFVMECKGEIAIRKRVNKDIWQNLYEFPMVEIKAEKDDLSVLQKTPLWQDIAPKIEQISKLKPEKRKQELTHQSIRACFWKIKIAEKPKNSYDFMWIDSKNLPNFAFPKIITSFLGMQQ